ncbi:MAG: DNA-binding protein [Planctomycetota bacterium]
MLTRGDLQKLAQIRLDDALLLHQAGRSSSAYYLAGYAVELALKACISRLIVADIIPEKGFINAVYTHKLDDLPSTAGLKRGFDRASREDFELATNWGVACQWSESSRYEFWDLESSAAMPWAIRDPEHGVFRWVKQHW